MDRRFRSLLLGSPFYFWFAFFVIGPVSILLVTSLSVRDPYGVVRFGEWTLASYRDLFDWLYLKIFLRTVQFALINTVCCLLIAFPIAFWLSRLSRTLQTWGITLIMIPFWTSFLVRVLAFMDLLHMNIGGVSLLYTSIGVQAAMVYNYLPFAILPLFAAMEKIENSWIEAAQDLGAGTWQIVTKLLIPLSKAGLISAGLFVFIPSLGEFLIPQLVGGERQFFLGTFLQDQFLSARNWPLGSAAIILIVILTLAFLVLQVLLTRTSTENMETNSDG